MFHACEEVLELMEACDNHSETHTVAEFVEFCVNGRTAKSGKWDTIGVGKYLEGGKAAGGQLVDQRFCPRICWLQQQALCFCSLRFPLSLNMFSFRSCLMCLAKDCGG